MIKEDVSSIGALLDQSIDYIDDIVAGLEGLKETFQSLSNVLDNLEMDFDEDWEFRGMREILSL